MYIVYRTPWQLQWGFDQILLFELACRLSQNLVPSVLACTSGTQAWTILNLLQWIYTFMVYESAPAINPWKYPIITHRHSLKVGLVFFKFYYYYFFWGGGRGRLLVLCWLVGMLIICHQRHLAKNSYEELEKITLDLFQNCDVLKEYQN